MRVTVDPNLCQAYGNCVLAAPDFFALDDSSPIVRVIEAEPPESRRAEVEEAVQSCPVEALTLIET